MELSLASVLWRLAAVVALICGNGLFVAAEYAIVTVRKTRVDQLVAEGNRRARAVRRVVSAPDRYIAATQLGITMASLALGWVGEPLIANIIQPEFAFLPVQIQQTTAHTVAVVIAFTLITAGELIFGELVPKWIALERAETAALWLTPPTALFMRVFWPFIRLLHDTAQAVVRALGMKGAGRGSIAHSEEELKMLVTASQEAGVLEEGEEQMLHRVFAFADLTAGQVMAPRTEMTAIDAGSPREEVVALVARGHTRVPVYRGDLDNVLGILQVTDLVRALGDGGHIDLAALSREALTVPETLRADDLLAAMRRRGVGEAIVIDEHGGTAGFVTFESLMERIVGDLGGFGTGPAKIAVRADGSADIDGLALVTDLNDQFALHIDQATFTTAGGYVLGRLGRRPRVGDAIDVEGRQMRVTAIDGLRVARVWLSAPARTARAQPPTAE